MSVSRKQIQYAAPTGPYKVFVKDKGVWNQHAEARLQISMGNPKHGGEKFWALCEWTASRFDHVTLIVSDTLHRHNLTAIFNMNEQQALVRSLKMGDVWLEQNASAISLLPSKTITRWSEWLAHKDFQKTFKILTGLYEGNAGVRQVIQEKAGEFTQRHTGDSLGPLSAKMLKASTAYLLEEVAVFACMFKDRAVDVYPGSWLKDVFDTLAVADPKTFSSFQSAVCLRVDFTRNRAATAQPEAALKIA